jgi:hypothetical protein
VEPPPYEITRPAGAGGGAGGPDDGEHWD